MARPIIGITSSLSEGYLGMERSCIGQDYVRAILAADGVPVGIPVGLEREERERLRQVLDGVLFPGGGDIAPRHYGQEAHPRLGSLEESRDELELPLASEALEHDLPVLGICRGIQVLAVAAGGTLYQDLPSQLAEVLPHQVSRQGKDHLAHAITVEPASVLGRVTGRDTLDVNSRHHQAVMDVPRGFVITARAPDGVIEAMELPSHPFAVGIQCHPENTWNSTAKDFAGLFQAFVRAAARRAEARGR